MRPKRPCEVIFFLSDCVSRLLVDVNKINKTTRFQTKNIFIDGTWGIQMGTE